MKLMFPQLVATLASLIVGSAVLAPALAEDVTVRFGFAQVGVGNRQFGSGNSAAIAHAQGLVEAEFKDNPGVRIDWSFFKGAGPAVNEALANDQLDFALHGDLPSIVGRSNGLRTKIVAANGVRANIYLAVRPSSGIERIEDLKGRKVAQFRGTNLQLATDKVLAAHGLTERDVRFISMDFATATAALASGDIDAAFGQADYLALEKQGVARVIYSTKGDNPAFTRHSHVHVTEKFEQAHPDLVARVVKALVKAAAWASDENNRDAVFETWAKSGIPAETFRADFDGQALKLRSTPLIDDFLIAAYRDQAERARQYRLLRAEVSIDDWFEPKYVEQAVKDLGLEDYWPRYDAQGVAEVASR
jgi:sulfonate transport system substrate-binding protein